MANADSLNLPDTTQVYKLDSLSGVASTWNNALSSLDIGSIDVLREFSPLIDNDVAKNFFNQLNDCIKSVNNDILNLIASITYLVSEQNAIDTKGKEHADDTPRYKDPGGNFTGGTKTSDYDKTKEVKLDDDLIGQFMDFINELDDYEHISLINSLFSISNNNLHDLLFDEKATYANELKTVLENLLKKGKITEEFKNKLLNLGDNEVQVLFRNILTNGKAISDFSKIIYTSVNVDKSEEGVKELSDNFIDTYGKISYDDIQKDLKAIYDGDAGANVSDATVSVTRNFVDTIASLSNTTATEILTDSVHADNLKILTSDLIKTFVYIDAAGSMGSDSLKTLCSNITVRGNTNA